MITHLAPNRISVLPNVARNGRTAASGRAARAPSATAFVSKVVLVAIAIVMAIAVIATAPQTVTIPVIAVLGTGLVASTLIVMGDRWLARRGRRRADERRLAAPAASQHPGSASRDNHDIEAPAQAAGWGAMGAWGALGATSVSLLMISLVVDERLGGALAVLGLAGLAAFRVAAMYGGWVPRASRALYRGRGGSSLRSRDRHRVAAHPSNRALTRCLGHSG